MLERRFLWGVAGSSAAAARRASAMVLPLLLGLASCALFTSAPPPPPEPCKTVPLEVYAKGSADQNPNAEGQALPVELRVLVLAQREAFDQLDLTELLSEEKDEELEKTVLQRASVVLMPGQEQLLPLNVPAGAGYVGLVANFRRIEPGQGKRLVDVTRAVERCRPGQLNTQIPVTVKESRLSAPERVE